MSFLINPYIYAAGGGLTNDFSVNFPTYSTTPANIEYLKINNQSNAIDTTIRDTTPNFSITGWVKFISSSNGQYVNLFSKYDNYAGWDRCFLIRKIDTNKIQIYGQYDATNSTISCITTATYTDTTGWFHFAFVYDSSQTTAGTIKKFYINGTEVTAWDTESVNTTQKYFMNQTISTRRAYVATCDFAGASARLPSRGASGYYDEFSFWDKSLSSSEVSEIYNSGAAYDLSSMTDYATNCLGWWRMGDGASDNWDGSKWNFVTETATSSVDFESVNLVEADVQGDVP